VLADHALRDLARLEAVVEAQSSNVRVRADALYSRDLSHVAGGRRHGDVGGHGFGLRCGCPKAAAAITRAGGGVLLWRSVAFFGLIATALDARARAAGRYTTEALPQFCGSVGKQ